MKTTENLVNDKSHYFTGDKNQLLPPPADDDDMPVSVVGNTLFPYRRFQAPKYITFC